MTATGRKPDDFSHAHVPPQGLRALVSRSPQASTSECNHDGNPAHRRNAGAFRGLPQNESLSAAMVIRPGEAEAHPLRAVRGGTQQEIPFPASHSISFCRVECVSCRCANHRIGNRRRQRFPKNVCANSEQLFGRSGRRSPRSILRSASASPSAARNISSTENAKSAPARCSSSWMKSTEFSSGGSRAALGQRGRATAANVLIDVHAASVAGMRTARPIQQYPRGVWYGSQGPQRIVIGRSLAEHSSRLARFSTSRDRPPSRRGARAPVSLRKMTCRPVAASSDCHTVQGHRRAQPFSAIRMRGAA